MKLIQELLSHPDELPSPICFTVFYTVLFVKNNLHGFNSWF